MEPPYVKMGGEAEAEAELKQHGHWTVAGITQSIAWTNKRATVEYGGRTYVLLPEDEKLYPAIALRGDPDTARRAILELASALAWVEHGAVTIESWGGGSHPFRIGKRIGGQITAAKFQIDYLPAPAEKNQKLALAMYHEGTSLVHVHVAYSFLSFYKIVNLVSGITGKEQIAWINSNTGAIGNHRTSERLKQLQKDGHSIGEYIYQSCRCAIAHAGDPRNPVIDPHDIEDQKRLYADLPLVIALAQVALEKELGIKSTHTVYNEHRYELSGFEPFLDRTLVEKLKAGETPEGGTINIPPSFSVRMSGKAPYAVLEGVTPQPATVQNGVLAIPCLSKSKRVMVIIVLDFPNYRLRAEVGNPEGIEDDGSAEFIDEMIEINEFFWDWNCNGKLEVWSDEGECLGRCDAFMPVNVMLNPDGHKAQQEELAKEATRRRTDKTGSE